MPNFNFAELIFSMYLAVAGRLTPLCHLHRADQCNSKTTFINPASTQITIAKTAMPVDVYLKPTIKGEAGAD